MKRMHVHVAVRDLDRSIAFYATLFGASPAVRKADYAKWMVDDPRLRFAISSGHHAAHGIEHLGIQTEDDVELGDVFQRLEDAEGRVLAEGATTCCYARSEKSWIADPDSVLWEAFLTRGEATVYGEDTTLSAASGAAAPGTWCAPAMTAPPAADAARCGG